jgi:hypothetical protein
MQTPRVEGRRSEARAKGQQSVPENNYHFTMSGTLLMMACLACDYHTAVSSFQQIKKIEARFL